MLTRLTRPVVRQTDALDSRTRKPIVIRLEAGGLLVRLWAKGERTRYTIHVRQLWILGGENRAAEIKAEKLRRREERRSERGS
jgi:hypothetical protein